MIETSFFDYKAGNAQKLGWRELWSSATVATIAALENRTVKKDAAITGTIESDGTIGEMGGMTRFFTEAPFPDNLNIFLIHKEL